MIRTLLRKNLLTSSDGSLWLAAVLGSTGVAVCDGLETFPGWAWLLMGLFLLHPKSEFFIREITRKLSEQINSVRRELNNLKKVGLLKTKSKNRKKYYYINKNFALLDEFANIFTKV